MDDGSVVAVSRDKTYKNTNVDFRIDPTTGEYQSASVDEYPGKESVNITANTLSRFKAEDAGTAAKPNGLSTLRPRLNRPAW